MLIYTQEIRIYNRVRFMITNLFKKDPYTVKCFFKF